MKEKLHTIRFDGRDGKNKTLIIKTVTKPDGAIGGCTEQSLLMDTFLHEPCVQKYNTMMDAIEAMVLAHACCGVDIESEGYVEGVRVAYEAACNNAF